MLDVDSMERAAHPTEFARSESLQNRGRHVAAEFQRQPRWVVSIRESGQAVAGKRLMVLRFPPDIVEGSCICCEHDLEHSCVFLAVHLLPELSPGCGLHCPVYAIYRGGPLRCGEEQGGVTRWFPEYEVGRPRCITHIGFEQFLRFRHDVLVDGCAVQACSSLEQRSTPLMPCSSPCAAASL